MARGDLTEFRVNPALTETPQVAAPVARSAAPQQIMQIGQGLERAGSAASSLFEDQLREANKVKVDEALIKASDRQLEQTFGQNGYTKLKGNDALERPDGKSLVEEYGKSFDDDLENIGATLGNDAQRMAFKQAASRMSLDLRGKLSQHTAQQFEVHKESVREAGVANAQQTISLFVRDPEKTAAGFARIDALTAEYADQAGAESPEERDLIRRKLGTPAVLGAIDALGGEEDWEAADKYFEEHREYLDGIGQQKAYQLIENGLSIQRANKIGDEVFAGTVGAQSASEPEEFVSPVGGSIDHKFGEQRGAGRVHKGIDIAVPVGSAVHAPISGKVKIKSDPNGYGDYYVIDAGDGHTEVRLAHLSELSLKDGAVVTQGQVMGKSGGARGAKGSGNSQGPHLHYEVRVDGKPVDPTGRLKTRGGSASGGSTPTLADGIRAIRDRTDIRETDKNRAIQRFKENFALKQNADEEAKKAVRDEAFMYAYKNPGANLPASIVSRLDPSDLPGIVGFSNSMRERLQKGTEVDDDVSLGTYATAREGIATGKIKDVNGLIPYMAGLTRSDAKQLIDDVTQKGKGDQGKIDSLKNTQTALTQMSAELAGKGMTVKDDPEEYARFKGSVYRAIAREERRVGRSLTGDETRPIVLGMLGDAAVRGNFGTTKKPTYRVTYDDIPRDMRAQIVNSLRRQLGRSDIPQGLVVQEFRRMQAVNTQ